MNMTGKIGAHGMTILELMTTLAVAAILVTIGVPSMTKFFANMRLVTMTNDLIEDIVHARNEAATRGRRVALCASQTVQAVETASGRSTCAATGTTAWATGRIVFVDMDGDGVRDVTTNAATNDVLLKKTFALPTGYSLTASGFTDNAHLVFSTFGRKLEIAGLPSSTTNSFNTSTTGSFKLCYSGSANGYLVSVNFAGRPISTPVPCP